MMKKNCRSVGDTAAGNGDDQRDHRLTSPSIPRDTKNCQDKLSQPRGAWGLIVSALADLGAREIERREEIWRRLDNPSIDEAGGEHEYSL